MKVIQKLLIIISCFFLSSCYTPDNFTGEVIIDKKGNYIISYMGDLIWAPLMREINLGQIPQEQIPEKINNIYKDLARESGFITIKSKGKGRFFVKYKVMGKITGTSNVTFVRGNNNPIIQIKTDKNKVTTFRGAYLSQKKAQQLTDANISIDGVFRLITDAEVLSNNAMNINKNDKGDGDIYEWNINSFDSIAPKLSLKIDFVE